MKICFLAQTLGYLQGGGHFWAYLNRALGFQRAGVEVTWLESLNPKLTPEQFKVSRATLESYLKAYGLAGDPGFIRHDGRALSEEYGPVPSLSDIIESSDLLVNCHYNLPASFTHLFRRTALIDIDPGLLQYWVTSGCFNLAPHDYYFSISDAVGKPGHPIPSLGLNWRHSPPCVDTVSWPVTPSAPNSAYTTISHWEAEEYVVESPESFYDNTKKAAFEPFLTLPQVVPIPLELAIYLNPNDGQEWRRIRNLGWRVRRSLEVASTPQSYQEYVQQSRGEFSVSKPSYVKMQSGWISDRTVCFLASGKPVVVQDTGPIGFLPPGLSFRRFQFLAQAAKHLRAIEQDYAGHCQAARELAETVFDARRVAERFLDVTLGGV